MTVGEIVLTWRAASLGVDDESLVGQELVGHLHGALQQAAGVVAQVDDEVLEALLLEVGQCDEQFGIGLLAEILILI